jgi:hypothetical protein
MDFYRRVKTQFLEDRNNRGFRDNVLINRTALRFFIEDYERLDELIRKKEILHGTFDHFESVIRSEFFENKKNCGVIFMRISQILKPLIEEQEKRDRIEKVYK